MEKVEVYSDKPVMFMVALFCIFIVLVAVAPEQNGQSNQLGLLRYFMVIIASLGAIWAFYQIGRRTPIMVLTRDGLLDQGVPYWPIFIRWDDIKEIYYMGFWSKSRGIYIALKQNKLLLARQLTSNFWRKYHQKWSKTSNRRLTCSGLPLSLKNFTKFLDNYRQAALSGGPTVSASWFPRVKEIVVKSTIEGIS